MQEWKVVYHCTCHSESHVVSGWRSIRALIRLASSDVRYVDIGPAIGPYLARFVMR